MTRAPYSQVVESRGDQPEGGRSHAPGRWAAPRPQARTGAPPPQSPREAQAPGPPARCVEEPDATGLASAPGPAGRRGCSRRIGSWRPAPPRPRCFRVAPPPAPVKAFTHVEGRLRVDPLDPWGQPPDRHKATPRALP